MGILCVVCASTGLAATNYYNFDTAHGNFKYPVIKEGDIDEDDGEFCCKLYKHPERMEFLQLS